MFLQLYVFAKEVLIGIVSLSSEATIIIVWLLVAEKEIVGTLKRKFSILFHGERDNWIPYGFNVCSLGELVALCAATNAAYLHSIYDRRKIIVIKLLLSIFNCNWVDTRWQ
jgi:hypothetical protein